MVDAIVPSFFCQFWVTVILLEETNRFAVAYANHNLTLFTVLTRGAVGSQQVYVVLRIGNTHTSRLWLHPWEGSQRHGSFRLSETFHHADACFFLELVEDGWVQGLAGCAAILQ